MSVTPLVLVGKPGCHLCDDARVIVARVCAELGWAWEERSILSDAGLAAEYGELIPVVLLGGRPISHWFVDEADLRSALTAR